MNTHRVVKKRRVLLQSEKRGECSVCEEDQIEIHIAGVESFKICRKLESQVLQALLKSRREGFELESVVGYRVGKTRGALNSRGLRTEFSNHSYGVALDVNASKNGLYDACFVFGPACRLLQGGIYNPERKDHSTISLASPLYKALVEAGFRWGGELAGKQKDFMHFSLSGD